MQRSQMHEIGSWNCGSEVNGEKIMSKLKKKNTKNTMGRTPRKAVVEFIGAFGTKVTISLSHVEYIKEDKKIAGKSGTLIYFTSGNQLFVDTEYDKVRDILNAFKMALTQY